VNEGAGEEVLLRLPPQPEFVWTARLVAAAFARQHAFGEEQVDDLKIAVSEAVTNAVRAHLDAGSDDSVTLVAKMDGDAMMVDIIDKGRGFDPDAIPDLGRTPLPGSLEGGLGLTVIRTLFSETTLEREPEGGMRLHLILKREAEPADLFS
jgi:serine/threonine-protein kinase RsbW